MKTYGLSSNALQGFGYLITAQLPWITTMLFAVRGMATQTELFGNFIVDSEFLWCPSLALPDPFGVLPLLSTTAVVLSSVRTQPDPAVAAGRGRTLSARDQKYLRYAMNGACFTFLPLAMHLPAGIMIFFIFNTVVNRVSVPLIVMFSRQNKPHVLSSTT